MTINEKGNTMTRDQNGNRASKDIRREENGWGRNVWFGRHYVTDVRRHVYRTRAQARRGDGIGLIETR